MKLILVYYFVLISVIVTLFQFALALGAPLGSYTLGGKFEKSIPKKMRWLPIVQVIILWFFVYIVLNKAEIISTLPNIVSSVVIWIVCLFFLLGSLANLSSPSKPERILWGPINVLTFVAILLLAIS